MDYNSQFPRRPNPFLQFNQQPSLPVPQHQLKGGVFNPFAPSQNIVYGDAVPALNPPRLSHQPQIHPPIYQPPQFQPQHQPISHFNQFQQGHPVQTSNTPYPQPQQQPRLLDPKTITKHHLLASRQAHYSTLSPAQKTEQDEWAWWVIDMLAVCPCGYQWSREEKEKRYRCLGGFHFMSDKHLSTGKFSGRSRPRRSKMREGMWEVLRALYGWAERAQVVEGGRR